MNGKYRWRTALRQVLPWRAPMFQLVPKGRDCGNHEWYRHAGNLWHCYHCKAERAEG